MPRGDRTGPSGMGPMTGRAAGYCAGYNVPGYMNPYEGQGRGLARGYRGGGGGGRGFRRGFVSPFQVNPPLYQPYAGGFYPQTDPVPLGNFPGAPFQDKNQELEVLKSNADYLTSALEDVKHRIEELESVITEKQKKDKS